MTVTLFCAALFGCQPIRAAIDRGELTEACLLADESRLDEADPQRNHLDTQLASQTDITWNVERISLLDLLPQEALATATGLEELRAKTFYRVSFEARALPAGASVMLELPALFPPPQDETLRAFKTKSLATGMDDVSLLLREPPSPAYEAVPAQYLPREFVEESEQGKWVYRGDVDSLQLALALFTAGVSAIFFPAMGRDAQKVPLSPAEKAAWEKWSASRRKDFEHDEAVRLAEGRKVVEALLARNQATKARYEQQLAATRTLRGALAALVDAGDCTAEVFNRYRLEAGRRCSIVATTWDHAFGPSVGTAAVGLVTFKGELLLGSKACSWRFTEAVPAVGDETLAQLTARVFSSGPRRMQPVRRGWTDFR
jgi:hypothetical protein